MSVCAICGMPFSDARFLKKTTTKNLPNGTIIGYDTHALYHSQDKKYSFCGPEHSSEWHNKNTYGHSLASQIQNHKTKIMEQV